MVLLISLILEVSFSVFEGTGWRIECFRACEHISGKAAEGNNW